MKCPTCSSITGIEVNLKADGFAENLLECVHCGAVWTLKGRVAIVIHSGKR